MLKEPGENSACSLKYSAYNHSMHYIVYSSE